MSLPSQVEHEEPSIAVLLPCYNEELTIGAVVAGFRDALPSAAIYVYDNNSSDFTALKARAAGAIVVREPRQGKGNVVRRMFSDIDADVYVMADGDGTYRPEDSPLLVTTLFSERCDMVVGTRSGVKDDAGRTGHAFGNAIFNRIYHFLFGRDFTDIFSGYRVFSRRFVKSFPAVSHGFEIETEMSVHASQLRMPVAEISLEYGRRPEGSTSKLSTFRDGARILRMFAMLMKETQPFAFFSILSTAVIALAVGIFLPVFAAYLETGLVARMPTLVMTTALGLTGVLLFICGVILDSVARGRVETKRIFYLTLDAARPERRNVMRIQGSADANPKPDERKKTDKAA